MIRITLGSTSDPFIDESNYTLTNDNLLGDGNHTDEFANPELPDPIQLDRNQTEFPDDHILEPLLPRSKWFIGLFTTT